MLSSRTIERRSTQSGGIGEDQGKCQRFSSSSSSQLQIFFSTRSRSRDGHPSFWKATIQESKALTDQKSARIYSHPSSADTNQISTEAELKIYIAGKQRTPAYVRREQPAEDLEMTSATDKLMLGAGFSALNTTTKRGYSKLIQEPPFTDTRPLLRRKRNLNYRSEKVSSYGTQKQPTCYHIQGQVGGIKHTRIRESERLPSPVSQASKRSLNSTRSNSKVNPGDSTPNHGHKQTPSTSSLIASYLGTSADLFNQKRHSLTQSFRDSASKAKDAIYSTPSASDSEASITTFFCAGESTRSYNVKRPSTPELEKSRRLSPDYTVYTDPLPLSGNNECKSCTKIQLVGGSGLCQNCWSTFGEHKSQRLDPLSEDQETNCKALPPIPLEISHPKIKTAAKVAENQNPSSAPRRVSHVGIRLGSVSAGKQPILSTPSRQKSHEGSIGQTTPFPTTISRNVKQESRLGFWSKYNTLNTTSRESEEIEMLIQREGQRGSDGRFQEWRSSEFYELYSDVLDAYSEPSSIGGESGMENAF